MRTRVGILGAGPAGLTLARLLQAAGVDTVVVESRRRAHVERRVRAGVLEQWTVDLLTEHGVGGRLDRDGLVHGGVHLRGTADGAGTCRCPSSPGPVDRHLRPAGSGQGPHRRPARRAGRRCCSRRRPGSSKTSGATGPASSCTVRTDRGRARVRRRRGMRRVPRRGPSRHAAGQPPGLRPRVPVRLVGDPRHVATVHRRARLRPASPRIRPAACVPGGQPPLRAMPAVAGSGAWPDDHIWEELHIRLASPGWTLTRGPIPDHPSRHAQLRRRADAARPAVPRGRRRAHRSADRSEGAELAISDVAVLAPAVTAGRAAAPSRARRVLRDGAAPGVEGPGLLVPDDRADAPARGPL